VVGNHQPSVETPAAQVAAVTELILDVPPEGMEPAALAAWTDRLVADTASGVGSLAVRLTDLPTMQALNLQYRGVDAPTDVLSFAGEVSPEGRHLGDIVIAVPVAARQAAAAGHPLVTELKTLILHGILHCLGHDHETDDGEMENLESELRAVWVNGDG